MASVLAKYKNKGASSLGSLVQETKTPAAVEKPIQKKSTPAAPKKALKPLASYFGSKAQAKKSVVKTAVKVAPMDTLVKPSASKQAVAKLIKNIQPPKVAKLSVKPSSSLKPKTLKLTKIIVPKAEPDADAEAFEASTANLVSKDNSASQVAADINTSDEFATKTAKDSKPTQSTAQT